MPNLIWRSQKKKKKKKIGADLIWGSQGKNKFGTDLIWRFEALCTNCTKFSLHQNFFS